MTDAMDPRDYETAGVSEMGGGAFDLSSLTASDAPFISAQDDTPEPDHTASADADVTPLPERGRKRRNRRADEGGSRAPKGTPEIPKVRAGSLVKPLTQFYTSVGTTILPFDAACGTAVIEQAEACAKSIDTLAQQNEAVRRAILAFTQTSAWGGVMIAHAPLLLMIMAHHGSREVAERVMPLAAMMNPNAVAAAQAQDERETA